MSSEAQRLINISLGKIASSRNQRGGLRLHKSLMVANVIVQARTQALIESTLTRPQSSILNLTENSNSDDDLRVPAVIRSDEILRRTPAKLGCEDCETFDSDDEGGMSLDFELDFETKAEDSSKRVCRKRKRSIEDDVENTDTSPKPAKIFVSTDLGAVNTGGNDCTNSLLDSLQMCHLTQDFSDSFSSPSLYETHEFNKLNHAAESFGLSLGSSSFIKAQPVYETQSFNKLLPNTETFDMGLDDSDYNKDISLFQSDSLSDGISCSTQIREALETLTRPVISLTV